MTTPRIVDGARLSYGSIERFQHNDPEHLERVLKSIPEDRGKLVVVDGLYSAWKAISPTCPRSSRCAKIRRAADGG